MNYLKIVLLCWMENSHLLLLYGQQMHQHTSNFMKNTLYVKRHYGSKVVAVFDGYCEENNTKGFMHTQNQSFAHPVS